MAATRIRTPRTSRLASHRHAWRELIWSLEGPLKVLIECRVCKRTVLYRPRKLLRTPPEGMTAERFAEYQAMVLSKDFADELIAAFRDRLVSASSQQFSQALKKGIAPPIPTVDDLDAYRERTASRLALRKAA